MLLLLRNLIVPSLIKDIQLYMLKFKLFIRSICHKFSNSHYIVGWLLLVITSIFFAFVALRLSISVSDYLYGKKETDVSLTILRDLIAEFAYIILLPPCFVFHILVAYLQIGPVAWFILGMSWLSLLYFCYGDDDGDDVGKPKR